MALLSYVHIAAISVLISSSFALQATDSCSGVKSFYQTKGFGSLVLDRPALAENLNVCSGVYSCCTTQTEDRMSVQSMADIQAAVSNKSGDLAQLFLRIHDKYDAFFQQLIETARKSLDSLFGETYEDLYTDNKMVFMKFFEDLKLYYQGGVVDVTDIFDSFFTTLMQRAFKLLNPSYIVSTDYMQCIGDNLNVIKPFAELPQKLSNQVQRSFIAARTLVQALKTGERVALNVGKIYPTTTCVADYMKIAHCSKCSGHAAIKPCQNMCDSVLTECLCNFGGELNSAWNKYVEKMMAVVNRLDGSFDIESVLFPIGVKISEAIMMLQENKMSIKEAVTRQCGDLPKNPNATTSLFGIGGMYFNFGNTGKDLLGGFPNLNLDGLDDFDFNALDDIGKSLTKRSADTKASDRAGKGRKRRKSKRNRRRKAHQKVRDVTTSKHTAKHGGMHVNSDSDVNSDGMHLSTLLNEMRMAQRALKQFWKKLPEALCAESAEREPLKDCWNGKEIIKNIPELSDNSVTSHCANITSVPDPAIRRQIIILKDISAKLSHAYSGVDAAFLDGETPGVSSGDGSGEEDDEEVSEKETPNKEDNNKEETPSRKKDKLIRDLKDWEINLIQHALGRSVDTQMTLKDIKASIMKHPLFEQSNKNTSRVTSGEKFGNLTRIQHKQLKKIFGVLDGKDDFSRGHRVKSEIEELPELTEAPNAVITTSGSTGVAWYSFPTLVLALSLQWIYMMV